jgi:hypothetical protein
MMNDAMHSADANGVVQFPLLESSSVSRNDSFDIDDADNQSLVSQVSLVFIHSVEFSFVVSFIHLQAVKVARFSQ